MNIHEFADIMAIKELVGRISILADKKDFEHQVQLFSEDAVSETIAGGRTILHITGRKEMVRAFTQLLREMETVYHFNGQHEITLNGDNAKGTSYCFITLIGNEDGKKMRTAIGATYEDDYIRINNQWLVAKRVGRFEWQEKEAV